MAVVDLAKQVGTTKGDLYVYNGSNLIRLAVGTDTHVLTADSALAAGVKWAAGAGGGGDTNPGWINNLVGTSDADNFYWGGSDLSGSFTAQTVSGTATWTEQDNLLSVVANGQTSNDVAGQLTAHSFSVGDEWVVPILGALSIDTVVALWAGIVFTDGTLTSSNCVVGHLQIVQDGGGDTTYNSSNAFPILVGRSGTLTDVSTAPWVSDSVLSFLNSPVYIKLKYQAANTFRLSFSPDGVSYSVFGEADIAKTMTPTHVGVVASLGAAVDGIATFGPLKKVA